MADIPCTCGHNEEVHKFYSYSIRCSGCQYEQIILNPLKSGTHRSSIYCGCRKYRADNLLYLELEVARKEQMKVFGL